MVQPHGGRYPTPRGPGEAGPGTVAGRVGAVQEPRGEQVPERPVVPAGIEVPGQHLMAARAGHPPPDEVQIPPPLGGPPAPPGGRWVDRGQRQ